MAAAPPWGGRGAGERKEGRKRKDNGGWEQRLYITFVIICNGRRRAGRRDGKTVGFSYKEGRSRVVGIMSSLL